MTSKSGVAKKSQNEGDASGFPDPASAAGPKGGQPSNTIVLDSSDEGTTPKATGPRGPSKGAADSSAL